MARWRLDGQAADDLSLADATLFGDAAWQDDSLCEHEPAVFARVANYGSESKQANLTLSINGQPLRV